MSNSGEHMLAAVLASAHVRRTQQRVALPTQGYPLRLQSPALRSARLLPQETLPPWPGSFPARHCAQLVGQRALPRSELARAETTRAVSSAEPERAGPSPRTYLLARARDAMGPRLALWSSVLNQPTGLKVGLEEARHDSQETRQDQKPHAEGGVSRYEEQNNPQDRRQNAYANQYHKPNHWFLLLWLDGDEDPLPAGRTV